ncbi:DUF6879 family protein [Actinomadura bangladeshensis]|uniref:DUF6879 domain-containing protein n=1 Tax=Actinomadura bangladeshensis TaxID=453573 RepID=A0A6L9QNH5_9ACTN|nr:DUF6879 family protein [Actinomadura bangladeshensis]NEA26606.1 hypothetical protein [Actinomadura bangladeshensis]
MGTPLTNERFEDLLAAATDSAVHLELRDVYMADASFVKWLESGTVSTDPNDEWWISIIGKAVARGVDVQRARIVSEPLSDYSRWLWECTAPINLMAGEQVRWLPRQRTAGLVTPPTDFWVFDSAVLVWNHFSGDGEWAGNEVTRDRSLVTLCSTAFAAVWERAIDHSEYRPS